MLQMSQDMVKNWKYFGYRGKDLEGVYNKVQLFHSIEMPSRFWVYLMVLLKARVEIRRARKGFNPTLAV